MYREKEWKEFFAVEENVLSEGHREKVKRLSQEEYRLYRRRKKQSFAGFILDQVRFVAWKIWTLQGMTLSGLCAVFYCMYADGEKWYGRRLPLFLCVCGILTVLSAFPIFLRSARCKMLETELAARFSAGKMILAQMIFIGTGDICMLTVLFLMARRYCVPGSMVFVSLIIPFLTAAAACMMLWARGDWETFRRRGSAVCLIPFAGIFWLTEKHAEVFTPSSLPAWAAYAAVCIAVMVYQSERLARREDFERVYL